MQGLFGFGRRYQIAMPATSTIIEVTVIGKDRKGVVADITNFIFKNGGNIEKISQNVVRGLFGMQLEASFQKADRKELDKGLADLADKLKMEIKVHYQEPGRLRKVAILVSKEPHCLARLLQGRKKGEIKANIAVIIGSEGALKPMADEAGIPFHAVDHNDQVQAEKDILGLIEKYDADLIVLARYMRVLSPNFVWRYPNRIINIHPSLLPAFPGAFAYMQAYERGAKIVGCTAHYVTEDLDQGPIIFQDAFAIDTNETVESLKKKGQKIEAKTLLEAVKMHLDGRLEVYWGKVHVKPKRSR